MSVNNIPPNANYEPNGESCHTTKPADPAPPKQTWPKEALESDFANSGLKFDPAPVPKEPEDDGVDEQIWLPGGSNYTTDKPKPVAAPVDQQEGQRERFELWASREAGYPFPLELARMPGGEYKYQDTRIAWVTWRAALASSPQPAEKRKD